VIALALQRHCVDRAGALPSVMRGAQVDEIVGIVIRSIVVDMGELDNGGVNTRAHATARPRECGSGRTVAGILVAFTHDVMPLGRGHVSRKNDRNDLWVARPAVAVLTQIKLRIAGLGKGPRRAFRWAAKRQCEVRKSVGLSFTPGSWIGWSTEPAFLLVLGEYRGH
jgi:hypothetical protein